MGNQVVQEYPRCRYHATLPPRIVDNPIEDLALGEGWFDSPERTKTPVFDPSTAFLPAAAVAVDPPLVVVETEPKPKRSYGPYKRRATGV
jgi:hypothetical protein